MPQIVNGSVVALRYLQGHTPHTDPEPIESWEAYAGADMGFDWLDENGDWLAYGPSVERLIRPPWTEITMSATAPVGARAVNVWMDIGGRTDAPGTVAKGAIDGIELRVDGNLVTLVNPGGETGITGWLVSASGGMGVGGLATFTGPPSAPEGSAYFIGASNGGVAWAEQRYPLEISSRRMSLM